MDLSTKHCVPCEGGVRPFTKDIIEKYWKELKSNWKVIEDKKIRKVFKFKDFDQAMIFTNKVAKIAKSENHHPDIAISWNKVTLQLWTHAIGGLSDNDFIMAAKIDKI